MPRLGSRLSSTLRTEPHFSARPAMVMAPSRCRLTGDAADWAEAPSEHRIQSTAATAERLRSTRMCDFPRVPQNYERAPSTLARPRAGPLAMRILLKLRQLDLSLTPQVASAG